MLKCRHSNTQIALDFTMAGNKKNHLKTHICIHNYYLYILIGLCMATYDKRRVAVGVTSWCKLCVVHIYFPRLIYVYTQGVLEVRTKFLGGGVRESNDTFSKQSKRDVTINIFFWKKSVFSEMQINILFLTRLRDTNLFISIDCFSFLIRFSYVLVRLKINVFLINMYYLIESFIYLHFTTYIYHIIVVSSEKVFFISYHVYSKTKNFSIKAV